MFYFHENSNDQESPVNELLRVKLCICFLLDEDICLWMVAEKSNVWYLMAYSNAFVPKHQLPDVPF